VIIMCLGLTLQVSLSKPGLVTPPHQHKVKSNSLTGLGKKKGKYRGPN